MPTTHEVLNQPPELADRDLLELDPVLSRWVREALSAEAREELGSYGRLAGSAEYFQWGRDANRYPPELHTHDRFGHRVDQVSFHPSWHALMKASVEHGVASLPWERGADATAHRRRAALSFLGWQAEQGHGCPVSMTYAVVPALQVQPDVAEEWRAPLTSRVYDPSFAPRDRKRGVLMGMAMTEKQGGSDVRANTTRAVPENGRGPGEAYRLTGHKWFCSAPMNDAFLVLAQAEGGLSCFLLPRFTPDGETNTFRIQRLKDKLGNRSNASSEVELEHTWGRLVGEEGRGVPTIIEMVNATRLDCVIGASATMRQALTQAVHHCRHRKAFGRRLVEQPLMAQVLADLELEVSAATLLMLRVAETFDRSTGDEADEREALLRRVLTPVAKYWVTKQCTGVVREALECLGGAGYVEESILPRLYRESPLNAIWEGSGNVIALDLVRVVSRSPEAVEALEEVLVELDPDLRPEVEELGRELRDVATLEVRARWIVERLAMVTAAALLTATAPGAVADAYRRSRVERRRGRHFGALPSSVDGEAILAPTLEGLERTDAA